MYEYICEHCGAHLDPGEHCDCEVERRRNRKLHQRYYKNLFEYMKELEEIEHERIEI